MTTILDPNSWTNFNSGTRTMQAGLQAAGKQAARNTDQGARRRPPRLAEALAHVGRGVRPSAPGAHGEGRRACPLDLLRANPVNPISGNKILAGDSELDFVLPAALPLVWQRIYSSGQRRSGLLGQGWSTPLSSALQISEGQVLILDPFQRDIAFALPRAGEALYSLSEKITLERTGERSFELIDENGLCSQFAMLPRSFETAVLVGLVDANDNKISIAWNARHLPESVTDSAGRVFVMDYISHRGQMRLGGISVQRDAVDYEEPTTDVVMRYQYDELGNLSQVINRAGEVTRQFAYMNHIMIEHTQPGGLVSRYEYDEYEWTGKVTRNWTNNGMSWNFRYLNGETLVYDHLGRQELFRFDKRRRFTSMIDALGGETLRYLDNHGNLLGIDAPGGRNASFRYDRRSRPVREENNGRGTGIVYDARVDKPALITDALGATTALRYDARGNLLSVCNALGQRTVVQYDQHGSPLTVTDAAGGVTTFAYNRAAQVISRTDSAGHTSSYSYDVDGRLLRATDDQGAASVYGYDAAGRLVTALHPGGAVERYDYDALGRLLAHTDLAGKRTSYQLDVDGRPLKRIDTHGGVLEYRYDGARRLAELVDDKGRTQRFSYDALDRLVEHSAYDARLTRYRYDASGMLAAKEELGNDTRSDSGSSDTCRIDTCYSRDCAGQVVDKFITRASGTAGAEQLRLRFAYDALGRMTQAINADAIMSFEYDALGQLVAEHTESGGATTVLRHAYDALGQRSVSTLDDAGAPGADIQGGAAPQREHVGDVGDVGDVDGAPGGGSPCAHWLPPASRSEPALAGLFRNDPMGRTMPHMAGQVVAGEGRPVPARTCRYDQVGNLQAVDTGSAHDVIGPILATLQPQLQAGRHAAFDPTHDLLGDGARMPAEGRCDYDAHGNLVEQVAASQARLRCSWNGAHQLVEAVFTRDAQGEQPGVHTIRYAHDPLGRRIAQHDAQGSTRFCWDGSRLVRAAPQQGMAKDIAKDTATDTAKDTATDAAKDAAKDTATDLGQLRSSEAS
jgi:YD repeat-containing protein